MPESFAAPAEHIEEGTQAVLVRALVQVRVLAAAVVLVLWFARRPVDLASGVVPVLLSAGALALLTGGSLLALHRRGTTAGRVAEAAGHTGDVVVAVAAVAAAGRQGPAWLLLVVPVLAGAVRYRLRGALLTWLAVGSLHLAPPVLAGGPAADLLEQVGRVAVVLLVALPAAHLTEHLLLEVRGAARVHAAAEHRGDLLDVVAEASSRVNDLDEQVFEAALEAARGLGFAAADLWERTDEGWQRLAAHTPGLPLPDLAAHLRGAPCSDGPLLVDRATGDADEVAGLRLARLEAVVMTPVPGRRRGSVLRAVLRQGTPVNASQVECLELLARQAGVALRNGELISDLHTAREELEHQAFHDHLTGIANRALFTRRLEEAVAAAASSGTPMALLFCDLDRFKAVNDGLGHAVGNDLLVAAVGRLRSCLRGEALLARMGGDEFTLLLPQVGGRREVEEIADRVCKVLTEPFALAGNEVIISTSVGLAFGGPECADPGELLRRGDVAMYRSKARGRGCWTAWAQELEEATLSRLRLERDLRRTVDEDRLEVVFQPVLRGDGTVAGAETLARWHHPELGEVSPDVFIPVAEDSDLIVDLGRCVTRQAVAVAGRWLAGADPECFVALNVSTRQLVSASFADELDVLVRGAGLAPGRLLLEITERIVTSGPDAVRALHDLAARGYRLGLDDFGQGQTSLQHLRHFPLTVLKIDRGFVSDAGGDERVAVILRAIVRLGLDLSLGIIAEGVETDEQAEALRVLGCTYLQGYGVGRPVDAAELPPPAAARPVPALPAPREVPPVPVPWDA